MLRVLKLVLVKTKKSEAEKVEDYKPSELGKELQARPPRLHSPCPLPSPPTPPSTAPSPPSCPRFLGQP